MKSAVIKRSVAVAGHKTSVSVEDSFWDGLREIAHDRHVTLSNLIREIDSERTHANLSSAIRLFVLQYFRGAQQQRQRHALNAYGSIPALQSALAQRNI